MERAAGAKLGWPFMTKLSLGRHKSVRAAHWAVRLLFFGSPILCLAAPPSRACDPQQVFEKADALLKSKNYKEAEAALDPLQGCHNLSPIQMFNLGWLYGRAHDSKTALKIFQSVPSDVPDRSTHQYAIALSEFALGNYQGTVDALKGLEAQGLLDPRGANLLAVSYSKLGLYQNAYPIFVEDLKRNPNDLLAYLNLVTLFADTGNFKNAVDIANQATVAFPQSFEAFVARGAANTLLGKLDQSHSDFVTAVQLSPGNADARFLLALSDYKQGQFADAMTELEAAIKSGIVDSDLHYLLAECILKADPSKSAAALAELNQAIQLNTKSVSARTLRGKLLLESGNAKQAVDDLELAHQIDPTSRSALYNLARADSAIGKTEEAKSLFKQLNTQTTDSLGELSDQRLKKALGGDSSQ
jgi:tetratricopeptide (TPR) repeat protein